LTLSLQNVQCSVELDVDLSPAIPTFLQHLPLACDSLDMAHAFMPQLHLFTDRPVRLQHLKVHLVSPDRQAEQCPLPHMAHLTKLRTIELQLCGQLSHPGAVLAAVTRCPKTVEHLIVTDLHTFWNPKHDTYNLLAICSQGPGLTKLDLRCNRLSLSWGDIAYLRNLASLNLSHSNIRVDSNVLQQLTDLTSLNLVRSLWYQKGLQHDIADALVSFTAWPNLRILTISDCNLFGITTKLHVLGVEDLQVSWILQAVPCPRLRVCKKNWLLGIGHLVQCSIDAGIANCLVEVQMNFGDSRFATLFGDGLKQLLQSCHSLKVLHVGYGYESVPDTASFIRLDDQNGMQLADLSLRDICFISVDLSQAKALTALQLTRLNPARVQKLSCLCQLVCRPSFLWVTTYFTGGQTSVC